VDEFDGAGLFEPQDLGSDGRALRAHLEASPQLAWCMDGAGRLVAGNALWRAVAGLEPPTDWLGAVHEEDRPDVEAAWAAAHGAGRPFELQFRLLRAAAPPRWVLARVSPMRAANKGAVRWIGVGVDVHVLREAAQHRQLLLEELNHRVKNSLTVVQVIVRQTLSNALDAAALAKLEGRIRSIGAAHDLLTQQNWESARLGQVIGSTLEAFKEERARVRLEGPPVILQSRQVVTVAMALHELCTNALKHGALSTPTGRVEVSWRIVQPQEGRIEIVWRERGGPPVSPPEQSGFGSRMIQTALAGELSGEVRMEFPPEGLVCTIEGRLRPAREPQLLSPEPPRQDVA